MGSDHFFAAAVPSEACILCPCNAGTLRRGISNSVANPGRPYFKCSSLQCSKRKGGYFKWADKTVNDNEWINVPHCGGCNAGLCRFRKETSGPSAGRIEFLCTVKEGQGSCGYRVWQDELLMSMHQVNPNIPSPLTSTDSNDDIPVNYELADASLEREIVRKSKCSTSQAHKFSGEMSPNIISVHQVDANINPPPTSTDSDDDIQVNYKMIDAIVASDIAGNNQSPLSVTSQSHKSFGEISPNIKESVNSRVAHYVPSEAQPDAYDQAAKIMQNGLITAIEKMDAKDHEAMSKEAEKTFSILHNWYIDHNFEEHVKKLIFCARSLDKIEREQSIQGNHSHQSLEDPCSLQKRKMDEMNPKHDKAVKSVENGRKRLKVLETKISDTKDLLFQAEEELFFLKAEQVIVENELEKIVKEKEVLVDEYLGLSKAKEDSLKLNQQQKTEHCLAKAAFYSARASLRR